MTASIILNIPGLFGPWQGNEQPGLSLPNTPAINQILSRGTHVTSTDFIQARHSSAAYSYFYDFQRWPEQAVLLIEPVHLRADQRHVRVYGSELLAISSDEAKSISHALNEFIGLDKFRLEYAVPERWYLHLPELNDISFYPIVEALGRPIDDYLPQGKAAAEWHRRLNEWQMLLFDQPVNLQRQSDKKLTINGVWLWGNTSLLIPDLQSHQMIITDDKALTGYARENAMTVDSIPEHLDDLQPINGSIFVQLDTLSRPLAYQDEDKWSAALNEIESNWVAPALAALQRKKMQSLILQTAIDNKQYHFTLRPSLLWQFWRKSVSLQAWIQHG